MQINSTFNLKPYDNLDANYTVCCKLFYCQNMGCTIILTGLFPQASSFCQETFQYPFPLQWIIYKIQISLPALHITASCPSLSGDQHCNRKCLSKPIAFVLTINIFNVLVTTPSDHGSASQCFLKAFEGIVLVCYWCIRLKEENKIIQHCSSW